MADTRTTAVIPRVILTTGATIRADIRMDTALIHMVIITPTAPVTRIPTIDIPIEIPAIPS